MKSFKQLLFNDWRREVETFEIFRRISHPDVYLRDTGPMTRSFLDTGAMNWDTSVVLLASNMATPIVDSPELFTIDTSMDADLHSCLHYAYTLVQRWFQLQAPHRVGNVVDWPFEEIRRLVPSGAVIIEAYDTQYVGDTLLKKARLRFLVEDEASAVLLNMGK